MMIHVIVPSTQTLVERNDGVSKYTAYNIHINGWFHASVRYSALLRFAESIKLRFGHLHSLPDFPPKKLFGILQGAALDERRAGIAKYLQALVQKSEIVHNSPVERNILEFQLDSYRPSSSSVSIEVFLGDGSKVPLRCNVMLPTRDIMKLLADELNADFDLLYEYFGLFMVKPRHENRNDFDMIPVRLLCNFESPYVSLQLANQRSAAEKGFFYKLQLRRCVWDTRTQEKLLANNSIATLLFRQAKNELERGLLTTDSADVQLSLESLTMEEDAAKYVRLCSELPGYGFEHLGEFECVLNDKEEASHDDQTVACRLQVGRRQLVLTSLKDGQSHSYRATRIRIWRISQPPSVVDPLIFQFEFLAAKDAFRWITIHTEHAILLSLLLQSIGSEILSEHRESAKEAIRGSAVTEASSRSRENGSGFVRRLADREMIGVEVRAVSPDPDVLKSLQHVFASSSGSLGTHNSTFGMTITDDDL